MIATPFLSGARRCEQGRHDSSQSSVNGKTLGAPLHYTGRALSRSKDPEGLPPDGDRSGVAKLLLARGPQPCPRLLERPLQRRELHAACGASKWPNTPWGRTMVTGQPLRRHSSSRRSSTRALSPPYVPAAEVRGASSACGHGGGTA